MMYNKVILISRLVAAQNYIKPAQTNPLLTVTVAVNHPSKDQNRGEARFCPMWLSGKLAKLHEKLSYAQ